jgi:hypothetical protein
MENKNEFLDNLNKLSKEELVEVINRYKTGLNDIIFSYQYLPDICESTGFGVLNSAIGFLENMVQHAIQRNKIYSDWLLLRENSKDKFGEKLCYCGHTYKCTCADPDKKTFVQAVANHDIILDDPENGWELMSKSDEKDDYKKLYQKQYELYIKGITDKFISMQADDICDEWCDKVLIQKEALEYLKSNIISYNDWVAKYKN